MSTMTRKATFTILMAFLVYLSFVLVVLENAVALDSLDEIAKGVSRHLEFAGYSVEKKENIIFVKHPVKRSFVIKKYNGGILLRCVFRANKVATEKRAAYLGLINSLNAEATVPRFYADKENNFAIEAWINYYDKVSFGRLFDQWENDTYSLLGSKADVINHFLE